MRGARTDFPKHLALGLKTLYNKAFIETPVIWPDIAETVPSTLDKETYGWLGNVPKMREFLGRRVAYGLAEYGFTITNKKFEGTLEIDRDAIEDEQYGQLKLRASQLGVEAKRHPEELVVTLLVNGFATLCYDGQYFFDTDHSEGSSGTQSNKGTTALGIDGLETAIQAMRLFKDDKGKPFGANPNLLVVPPQLEMTALKLVQSPLIVTGTNATLPNTNVLQGRLKVLSSEYLTDANDWFLLDTRRVKPLLFQDRVKPEFKALEGDSESGFFEDCWYYGVRARYNVGYGMWQFAYGSSVT